MSVQTGRQSGGSHLMPAFEHATVADAMHPGVLTCSPQATSREIARMMVSHHVHCIMVMGLSAADGGESLAGGIVSDMDLVRAGVAGEDASAAALAGEPIITVEPEMALRAAVDMMTTRGADHVLVIDPATQHPVGVLSTLDVTGVMAWGEA